MASSRILPDIQENYSPGIDRSDPASRVAIPAFERAIGK
jgi:hypothetical protein